MGSNAAGNRTSEQDSQGGTQTVSYDADNRQTSEQLSAGGMSHSLRFDYAYNARGDVTSLAPRTRWG